MVWPIAYFSIMVAIQLPFAYAWRHWTLRNVEYHRRTEAIAAVRAATIRLQVAWTIAVIGFAGWFAYLWFAKDEGNVTHIRSMPVATIVAHLLFWPFVLPLLLGLQEALQRVGVLPEAYVPGPVRTATLKPRTLDQYLPDWMRIVTLGILGALAAVAIARLAMHPPEEFRQLLMSINFLACGVFLILGVHTILPRIELAQSFPPGGSAYTKAVESLRAFRIRCMYSLGACAAGLFLALAELDLEVSRGVIEESQMGVIGGSAGCLIGLAGAAVGAMCSLKAYRLEVLRKQDPAPDQHQAFPQTE